MAKKPNKMGRIEADPKPKMKLPVKKTLYMVSVLGLVALGVVITLQYQAFIERTKASGAGDFVAASCEEWSDEKTGQVWLECKPIK